MRYLNKICFINSATVKYAELDLNGNIHFIGTQGVGKSTLLRAILFFYNANSLKLGVPLGPTSRSFAQWYFPYQNSYIIYEVQRETGAFTILTFKVQNRVCFYFIDAPYRQELFIDADGKAFEAWDKIRAVLDANNIFYSRRIKAYEEYRDILYGNNQGKKEFQRYALLESRQYAKIPLTIQNVFLNSKLDAEFIKQTIIDSMGEEELQIDLQTYAHHLQDFETQLNDIRQFRKTAVVKQAQTAANLYVAINHLQRKRRGFVIALRSTLLKLEEQEPQIMEALIAEKQALQRVLAQISKEDASFKRRDGKYASELAILTDKLKTAKKKQERYTTLNIQKILQRVEQITSLNQQREDLLAEKNVLSGQFQDISQKYEALLVELENQFQRYYNIKEQEKLMVEKSFWGQRDEITTQYEKLQEEIRQQHHTEVESARQQYQELTHQCYQLKNKRAVAKQQFWYPVEIEQQKDKLGKLQLQLQRATMEKETNSRQLEELQRRGELEEKSLRESQQRDIEKTEQQLKECQRQIEDINRKLADSQNSFYGWLNKNHPGWEEHIGKVCAEEVLFKTALSPQKTSDGNKSFYGVELDLSQQAIQVKSLADYQHQRTLLQQQVDNSQAKIASLHQELETNLQKLRQRLQPKSRELRQTNRELDYQIGQNPHYCEAVQLALNQWEQKARQDKQHHLEKLQTELEATTDAELVAHQQLEKLENQLKRQLKAKLRERDLKISSLDEVKQQKLQEVDFAVATKQREYKQRQQKITADKHSELNVHGADTQRLQKIDQELGEIELELIFIEEHRDLVAEYKQDKRELFDRLKEFKNRQQLLEREREQKRNDFGHKACQHQQQKTDLLATIERHNNELKQIEADTDAFAKFKLSEVFTQLEGLFAENLEPQVGETSCREMIDVLNESYYTEVQRKNELREVIDKFLAYFSPDNIFKFQTRFISSQQYLDFSQDLTEFLEEDKISEFEKRTNERFAEIIVGLGKETTSLVSKAGDIQKIINKINRDFKEKNFVGAITSIELKLDESANTIFVVLRQIKEFNDKHGQDFGMQGLFSTEQHEENNQKAVELLRVLMREIEITRRETIALADSFELKFRVEENQNDTGWVEKLSHVGSDGTDVLVKAMVNIMLLNVFKEGASKRFRDFRLHCMMDEIGKLHPNNIRGIIKFANDRNIMLINGSPTENNALNYKHVFKVSKDNLGITKVVRILTNNRSLQ